MADAILRKAIRKVPNGRDRNLLRAGFNLTGSSEQSLEGRINEIWRDIDPGSTDYLEAESAIDKFRYELVNRVAWILSGNLEWRAAETTLELGRRLLNQGRVRQAEAALQKVVNSEGEDVSDKSEAWRLLALSASADGRTKEVLSAISEAVELCEGSAENEDLILTIDRLAVRLTDKESYTEAVSMVSNALRHLPHEGVLWRRLGCIHWYAGALVDAYSALSTALEEGASRPRVVHARGQVLAEMGRFGEAISELDEALSVARSTQSAAFARSTRAYAIGMNGDLGAALTEFDRAEAETPGNAWLHYFRGLCYHFYDMNTEAVEDLNRALSCDAPPLTRPKREMTLNILSEQARDEG